MCLPSHGDYIQSPSKKSDLYFHISLAFVGSQIAHSICKWPESEWLPQYKDGSLGQNMAEADIPKKLMTLQGYQHNQHEVISKGHTTPVLICCNSFSLFSPSKDNADKTYNVIGIQSHCWTLEIVCQVLLCLSLGVFFTTFKLKEKHKIIIL